MSLLVYNLGYLPIIVRRLEPDGASVRVRTTHVFPGTVGRYAHFNLLNGVVAVYTADPTETPQRVQFPGAAFGVFATSPTGIRCRYSRVQDNWHPCVYYMPDNNKPDLVRRLWVLLPMLGSSTLARPDREHLRYNLSTRSWHEFQPDSFKAQRRREGRRHLSHRAQAIRSGFELTFSNLVVQNKTLFFGLRHKNQRVECRGCTEFMLLDLQVKKATNSVVMSCVPFDTKTQMPMDAAIGPVTLVFENPEAVGRLAAATV